MSDTPIKQYFPHAVIAIFLLCTACSSNKSKSPDKTEPTIKRVALETPQTTATPQTQSNVQTPEDCTVEAKPGVRVDGRTLWVDVPVVSNCAFHQLAWNNFLYLTADGGGGHPRFMSFVPWHDLLPESGEPTWPGTFARLEPTKELTRDEAGDTFKLEDVNKQTTSYDMRVDKSFFDYMVKEKLYTRTRLDELARAYDLDPSSKGIWLPGGDVASKQAGFIEIKTSWRSFGSGEGKECPTNLMHCEKDTSGAWWGLVGFHLVQKTPSHGEALWASFEHVANAPDCQPGGSNPIAKEPRDPTNPSHTINVNKHIPELRDVTGWSYFNHAVYTQAGGKGGSCPVADGAYDPAAKTCGEPQATPLCNTDPQDNGAYKPVNVCRTDQLPPPDQDCTVPHTCNNYHVSWLNESVLKNFPQHLDGKWRYYFLVGSLWAALLEGADVDRTQGAPQVGCFSYESGMPDVPASGKETVYGFYCDPEDHDAAPKVEIEGTRYLANTTMETWMQKGMCAQYGPPSNKVWTSRNCFACHQPSTFGQPGKHFGQGDTSHIFTRIRQK